MEIQRGESLVKSQTPENYGLRPAAIEFPMQIVLSVIYPCNLGCPFCPYTDGNSEIRKFYHDQGGDLVPVWIFKKLADEAGLPMPKQSPEARERAQQQISLYGVLEAAAKWFEGRLKSEAGRGARDYLSGRGVTSETIKTFRLGFAPNSRNALKPALVGADISEALQISAGLLIELEGGGESYDRFRGRIIFPIMDRRGLYRHFY